LVDAAAEPPRRMTALPLFRPSGTAHHLPHRVGQGRDVPQRLGHGRDPVGVEGEPVQQALGHACGASALEVLGVGGDDLRAGRVEGVGHGAQRGVLVGPRQEGHPAGGGTGGSGQLGDLGHRGGIDGGHATSVCRRARHPDPRLPLRTRAAGGAGARHTGVFARMHE
jgi:hypothetical protein